MASKADGSGAEEPLFREFEHTGDLGIELSAPTRDELFRRAAVAMAFLLVECSGVGGTEERQVEVRADTDADLLHELLAELLDLFIIDGFVWCEAKVREHERSLVVTLRGERFDPSRHEFRGEIKAVTYHQLSVEQSPQGWRARVIFDV